MTADEIDPRFIPDEPLDEEVPDEEVAAGDDDGQV